MRWVVPVKLRLSVSHHFRSGRWHNCSLLRLCLRLAAYPACRSHCQLLRVLYSAYPFDPLRGYFAQSMILTTSSTIHLPRSPATPPTTLHINLANPLPSDISPCCHYPLSSSYHTAVCVSTTGSAASCRSPFALCAEKWRSLVNPH